MHILWVIAEECNQVSPSSGGGVETRHIPGAFLGFELGGAQAIN